MTVNQAEIILGPLGYGILDEQDWLRVVDENAYKGATIVGETTLLHEFGHMLQAKTGTKIPDTKHSPTKYGRTKEWEDYAESFLYFAYGKKMAGERSTIIARDVTTVVAQSLIQ